MSWHGLALLRLGAAAMLGLWCGGCLMHDVDKSPKPPVTLPGSFGDGSVDEADHGRWWTQFGDADLDRLVDQALERNLKLKQAWARLDQAKAMARASLAGLFPNIDASLQAGRSKSPSRVMDLGPPVGEQTIAGSESNSFSASLPLSYEIDVWGRVRSGIFAADQDVLAFRADIETAAITIAANVTERWFDVVEQRATRRLLKQQLRTNARFVELVALQFQQGLGALSDVYQQRQQVQLLQAQLLGTQTRERLAEQQLALLVGQPPGKIASPQRSGLPNPLPLPKTGVPASLLKRRPDLRAAQHRVVAADYRVGQAIAARFPTFGLSGSLGFSATQLSSFFESVVWSFVGSISASVWDGGRRGAEVKRSKAVVDERLAAYGDALLTALFEVESSLVQEKQQRKHIVILEQLVGTARRTFAAARLRFEAGTAGSYLPTLTALRSLQQAEQSLLAARRQLLSHRVQLYRALGSRWTAELKRPKDDNPQDDDSKEGKEAS